MDPKILLVIGLVLFVGYALTRSGGNIDGAKAHELVAGGAQLVDVRTKDEFAAGHLPGAINIPVQDLERRLGELGPKDRAIVVYCHSGQRSRRAARILRGAGHGDVSDLGAMRRW